MANEQVMNHITAATILNAASLIGAMMDEVLGNDASTRINGQDTNDCEVKANLVAVSIQASISEHLG